jgi:hypothetical protein
VTNDTKVPIDKSAWGDGPWQTEPDRVEWEHAGLPCLALRSEMGGNWCGYAAVLPGHPLHGTFDDDLDVHVHGGLTYANRCDGERICHVPKPGEPDDVWWFGFDCGHAWDIMPAMDARTRAYGQRPIHELFPEGPGELLRTMYRTLDYVQAETNRLAEQLAVWKEPPGS